MMNQEYPDRGLDLVQELFTVDELMPIRNMISEMVLNRCELLSPDQRAKFQNIPYEDLPHIGITELARINNDYVRHINDQLHVTPLYHSLLTQDKVLEVARQHTGATRKEHLAFVGFSFRLDLPNTFTEQEARISQPWHQDSAYYPKRCCNETSAVFWVPLYDCGIDEGCLETIEGSPSIGAVEHVWTEINADKTNHSRQTIPERAMNDAGGELTFLEAESGDAGLIHINMIHRTGTNRTDKVRYTMLVRVSNMLSPTYVP